MLVRGYGGDTPQETKGLWVSISDLDGSIGRCAWSSSSLHGDGCNGPEHYAADHEVVREQKRVTPRIPCEIVATIGYVRIQLSLEQSRLPLFPT